MREGQPGPSGQSIWEEMRIQKKQAENIANSEIEGRDSATNWEIYNSSLREYGGDFSQVIPSREDEAPYAPSPFSWDHADRETSEQREQRAIDFKNYLLEVLGDRVGKAVGIDFGGPGRRLFSDLEGVFAKSAGVLLHDHPTSSPTPPNHAIFEGDMLSLDMHKKVNQWLGEDKADVIFERVKGGKFGVQPFRLNILTLSRWYSILNENGVMFFEIPYLPGVKSRGIDAWERILEWEKYINDNYPGQISVFQKLDMVRLNKLPGAPEKLPIIKELGAEEDSHDEGPEKRLPEE